MAKLDNPFGAYTAFNRDALPIYHEACRILELPFSDRKMAIESHHQADRLAAEVIRIYQYRKKDRKKAR